jgi:RNA polymerase sigma factor (sigma-70 family)
VNSEIDAGAARLVQAQRAWMRYETSGDAADLDVAVHSIRALLAGLPLDDPQRNLMHNNLAMALTRRFQLGNSRDDLDEAIHLLRQLVAQAGPDATATAAQFSTLGDLLRARARLEGAIDSPDMSTAGRSYVAEATWAYEHALALYETVPELILERLAAMNNLAALLHQFRDLQGARSIQERVVWEYASELGIDHPDSLSAMNNLAAIVHDLGDHAAALNLYEQVLARRVQILGADNPQTLSAFNNLAAGLRDAGNLPKANGVISQAADVARNALGSSHPVTLALLSNYASIRIRLGDLPGARSLLEAVLQERTREYGAGHPSTFTTLSSLAEIARREGDEAEARRLQAPVLAHIAREQAIDDGTLSTLRATMAPEGTAETTESSYRADEAAALLDAVRAGDRGAWGIMVERYNPLLFKVVRDYRLAAEDAQDVVQTTWLQFLSHLEAVREPEKVGAWLVTAARRAALQALRRREPEPSKFEDVRDIVDGRQTEESPEAAYLREEQHRLIGEALGDLPPRTQQLLRALLSDDSGDYAEIAKSLGIPIGSIGPSRMRALMLLRRRLERTETGENGP